MPQLQNFKLIEKTKLTKEIFELIFEADEKFDFLNGQFITFLVPWIWWRAYSILDTNNKNITLIIKKRELESGWRWWSKFICELNIWDSLKWIWPAWHFLLRENSKNKLFLWTWTWLVPLYNQIVWALEKNLIWKLTLLFWSRFKDDLFYINKFEELKEKYNNFDYKIYLSKEKKSDFNKWYITDYLIKENVKQYEEFYICWAPSMIHNSKRILENCWISKENILSEEY